MRRGQWRLRGKRQIERKRRGEQRREAVASKALGEEVARAAAEETWKALDVKEEAEGCLKGGYSTHRDTFPRRTRRR